MGDSPAAHRACAVYARRVRGAALAQDITFTNRMATFSNLEGRLFFNVTLVKANQDGVIWRDGAGGGSGWYANLNPALLKNRWTRLLQKGLLAMLPLWRL
jgi:hypothetical protein